MLVAVAQLDRASYYDLLRVSPGAGRAELQQAFHAFALAFHPDRHRGEEDDVQQAAKQVFERGVEAYTVLRDPQCAAFYDTRHANGALRLTPEDFEQFARRDRLRASVHPPARTTKSPPSPESSFVEGMKTADGRIVAERVEKLIREQRYREAYLQIGLLETVEPNNPAIRRRADRIAEYLKRAAR